MSASAVYLVLLVEVVRGGEPLVVLDVGQTACHLLISTPVNLDFVAQSQGRAVKSHFCSCV